MAILSVVDISWPILCFVRSSELFFRTNANCDYEELPEFYWLWWPQFVLKWPELQAHYHQNSGGLRFPNKNLWQHSKGKTLMTFWQRLKTLPHNIPTIYWGVTCIECDSFSISSTLNSLSMARSCTATLFGATGPTMERSHISLTWSWAWAVKWSRTQCRGLCTLSMLIVTAALQAQADSTPAWTSTHPAASTTRCVWELKSWLCRNLLL